MSTKARFLYTDYVADATTITITDTAAGFSVDYIRTNRLLVPHRSQTDTSIVYTFDLGASYSIGAFAIAGHNFSDSATFIMERANQLAFSSGVSTLIANANVVKSDRLIWGAFTHSSQRYVRITVADPSNADGYQSVGRIVIGPYFEPADNWEHEFQRPSMDLSLRQVALNGSEDFVVRPTREGRRLRFPISTEDELELWQAFSEAVGTTRPFAVALDPDTRPDESFFARFTQRPDIPHIFGTGANQVNEAAIELLEVL